jgi:mRNA-degrading endonuclease RelE of RelBE toxin-antitoxin system
MPPSPTDDLFASVSEAAQGSLTMCWSTSQLRNELRKLWNPEIPAFPEDVVCCLKEPSIADSEESSFACRIEFSIESVEAIPWSFGFTPTFRKSVAGVDKKLQGRVLVALSELADAPLAVRGDTIKPLIGPLKGLWRYRIGEYRLVYQPREANRLIVLLEFAARGGVYECQQGA